MSSLTLKNIRKSFDKKIVLNKLDLQIEHGEFISLLGPSGCGKTTLLNIISGLLSPDFGEIEFEGNSVLNVKAENRGAVVVFQEYLLFPHMNIEQNIGFGLKMAKVDKREIKQRVEKLLKLIKLEGYGGKYPYELSGGQQQRVAIARAIAVKPKILLLDEPFSNLDASLRNEMRSFVKEIQRQFNITTILVTHDQEEALMISDRVALMLDGEIKQIDTPMNLYHNPCSIYIGKFLGERNYIEGEVCSNIFKCKFGEINLKEKDVRGNKQAVLMINPEDIEIVEYDKSILKGIINSMKFAGNRIYYEVTIGEEKLKIISSGRKIIPIGEKIGINIDLKKGKIF